jgi:hypothetical protein
LIRWNKDAYTGKNEKSYQVYFRTGLLRKVNIEYTQDAGRRIMFISTNTTGSVSSIGGQLPRNKVEGMSRA